MTRTIQAAALILGLASANLFAGPTAQARERPHTTALHVDQQNVQGIKSKAIKHAVKAMANLIRKGNGSKFYEVCGRLSADAAALQAFRRHSGRIADLLDDIASIPDLALNMVREQMFSMLTSPRGPIKMGGGPAKVITEIIVGALDIAF